MELEKLLKNIKLEDYQQRIYEGLKQIGEEIASLYYDGIVIFNSELSSKSYLLAHIAREIEGGIRDILTSGSTFSELFTILKLRKANVMYGLTLFKFL